jgi:carbon storage regulator
MLVIARKVGQRFRIGDSIVVTLLGIQGGSVRLGIEAPPDVRVLREELLSRAPRPANAQGVD